MWVHSNYMGRGDGTPLNLSVVQNGNGLRTLTTQESHAFKRVECQTNQIFRINADGTNLQQISSEPIHVADITDWK